MTGRRHLIRAGMTLLTFMVSAPAWTLQTLGVVGPVVEAEPFYTRLIQSSLPHIDAKLSASDIGRVERWSGFQAYDSGLKTIDFNPIPFSQQEAKRLITPLCLLANDAASIAWLKRTKAVLQRERAVCYLVKTNSPKDAKALQKAATGIPFIALNPTFVISQFNVPGYPALISRSGVEQ